MSRGPNPKHNLRSLLIPPLAVISADAPKLALPPELVLENPPPAPRPEPLPEPLRIRVPPVKADGSFLTRWL